VKNSPPQLLFKKRYHDLDALRAFAMLLGIGLHGFMSFVPFPLPVWPAQDVNQHDGYLFALHAIHGFRLQLFFLVSGFFTAMLFRQCGLRGLIKHRAKRILLPLVVFTILLSPAIIGIGIYGSILSSNRVGSETIWAAAKSGDVEAIQRHLAKGADPNQRDPAGLTPLSWAALLGQAEAANSLIEAGANLEITDNDGNTALHCAAFMGEVALVRLLVENGVDINAASNDGGTPLSATETDEVTTQFIAGLLQIPVDEKKVETGRIEIGEFLKTKGGLPRKTAVEDPMAWMVWLYPFIPGFKPILDQLPDSAQVVAIALAINWLLSVIPIFQHLWFLYYLAWLVAGFTAVVWVMRKLNWKPTAAWFVGSPLRLLWLVPLTFVPQFFMITDFGPDTAASPIPWPPVLVYYAVFFGFGAVCYGREALEKNIGRRWPISLLLAIPALLLGLHWYELRGSLFVSSESNHLPDLLVNHLLCALFSVLYAWLMVFGLIGLFRRFFSSGKRCIRYVSDSSYWLYVMHLPLVMLLQIWVADWPWPSAIKFLAICTITTVVLLCIYEYAVRYTWVGAMLNGRKSRQGGERHHT